MLFVSIKSAVIFVPDDTAKTGYAKPMMLQRVMGTPLLTWLVQSLLTDGVERYFLVCLDRFREEAKRCFPAEAELMTVSDAEAADRMHVFLSTAEDNEYQVMVVTGPCVYIAAEALIEDEEDAPLRAHACRVDREIFMEALDAADFSFGRFLVENGSAYTNREGMFSVTSVEELADWQPILKRSYLYDLAHRGVEIWDYDNCYVDPSARIGGGTELLPGTIIRGKCVVGHDCVIGPNAYLEDAVIGNATRINASQVYGATIGNDCNIGPYACIRQDCKLANRTRAGCFVELQDTKLGEGTQVPRLSHLSATEAGKNCDFGALSVSVNYDAQASDRIVVEDDAVIGCNTNLIAPVEIGCGAYVAAGTTLTDDVPAQALAIARVRQNNKRDWAGKNK